MQFLGQRRLRYYPAVFGHRSSFWGEPETAPNGLIAVQISLHGL
ncbi:MAG: hypothetical protein V3U34_02845 [candidate division NC10 bacterium]|jgi:hypothetical protein